MASSSLVHSARSLANKYEMILLESRHVSKNPSITQLQECFRIFDEIIPSLGQYRRVMRLIRDDIYEAVFSQEYTINIGTDRPGIETKRETVDVAKPASIARVPHYVILTKIIDERNKRAEDAEDRVEQMKIVIDELNEKIIALNHQIDELEDAIETQNKEIGNLKANSVHQSQESSRLREALQAQHEEMTSTTKSLERSIVDVTAELTKETAKVVELSRFKECHDDIQDSFKDPSAFSPNPKKTLSSVEERQKLRKDITEGKTLEEQLLKLRNTCIGEFEDYLEKEALEEKYDETASNKLRLESSFAGRSFDVLKTEERQKHVAAFTNMIDNTENELRQNELHVSALNAELQKLDIIKRKPQSKAKLVQFSDVGTTEEKGVSQDQDESDLLDVIKSADSKFLPQEAILNKYAITAHYSCNQGQTFHELQHVQHCKSCGQKTLVCPHKASTGERIFHLPLQCTHIKFTRPELHLPVIPKVDITEDETPSNLLQCHSVYAKLTTLTTRASSIRHARRIIQEKQLVFLINLFYASVVSDDFCDHEDETVPLLQLWQCFLNDRYQVPSVALSVAKDVAEAILKSANSNRFIRLFAECLCGYFDPATFRYYLILSHLVQTIQWTSMEDFSCFAKIVYPFMSVDDVEQITMSYRSFSKNRVSAKLISEFFLYIILKLREPRFHEMEDKLLNHSDTNTGNMNDVVFFEAVTEFSPLSSGRLCHRLFAQSKADGEADHVSISRLSQISSFLDLHQRTAVIEMELEEKLQVIKFGVKLEMADEYS